MKKFLKWLLLDWWLDKQVELGKQERERLSGQTPTETSTPSQSITEANDLDDDEEVVTSARMDQYLTAIRSNN